MTTYEKVVDGHVVERVTPVEGDHEDTRLGCVVLDGVDGWRVQGTEPQPAPPATRTRRTRSAPITKETR